VVIELVQGKLKDVHPILLVSALLFLANFVLAAL
jgi:xanthine/uracil/vitamin C permease (AzgA family)